MLYFEPMRQQVKAYLTEYVLGEESLRYADHLGPRALRDYASGLLAMVQEPTTDTVLRLFAQGVADQQRWAQTMQRIVEHENNLLRDTFDDYAAQALAPLFERLRAYGAVLPRPVLTEPVELAPGSVVQYLLRDERVEHYVEAVFVRMLSDGQTLLLVGVSDENRGRSVLGVPEELVHIPDASFQHSPFKFVQEEWRDVQEVRGGLLQTR